VATTPTKAEAEVIYQWLRDGKLIPGATNPTYKIAGADLCQEITVKAITVTSTKTSTAVTTGFTDVPTGHKFYKNICWAAQTGTTTGDGKGNYLPNQNITRGQMAAFLYRLKGAPTYTPPTKSPFTDVPTTHKFYKAITWLHTQGIAKGTCVNNICQYNPEGPTTRGQMAAFLYRYAGSPTYTTPAVSPFVDVKNGQTYFDKQINWFYDQGIGLGTLKNGQRYYQPTQPVTRAQMAAFLQRYTTTT
jgi:hypothetical protein